MPQTDQPLPGSAPASFSESPAQTAGKAPDTAHYFDVVDATWPAAAFHRVGPWCVREGQGGGKRVSSVSVEAPWQPEHIAQAEEAQRALGQYPLFQLRGEGDAALDAALEARGYQIVDPVLILSAPLQTVVADGHDRHDGYACWPPLAVAEEIWDAGGIGPDRRAVMARATGPHTAMLARFDNTPAGIAFVGLHEKTAMVHAVEVAKSQRRKGVARRLMVSAAAWAQDMGATRLSVVVTRENLPARGLYTSLGLGLVGHYHYRINKNAAKA